MVTPRKYSKTSCLAALLERLTQKILGLANVQEAFLFLRDRRGNDRSGLQIEKLFQIVGVLHHTSNPKSIIQEAMRFSPRIIVLRLEYAQFTSRIVSSNFEFVGHPLIN